MISPFQITLWEIEGQRIQDKIYEIIGLKYYRNENQTTAAL